MKKNFLLIEHGGSKKQFTLETLKKKNLNLYLACTSTPGWVKEIIPASRIINTETYNSIKLLTDITAYFESKKIKLDAIGNYLEHVVTQTADVASALNLIGLNPGAARRSSCNKLLMRITCRNAGIQTPKFAVTNGFNKKNLSEAINKIGIPCVVKPIFGAESYGTIKIEKNSSLDNIVKEIKLNTTSDKKETYKNFTGICLIE